jgi:hypothetical protein
MDVRLYKTICGWECVITDDFGKKYFGTGTTEDSAKQCANFIKDVIFANRVKTRKEKHG